MFTWSLGCAPSPARFAMTSLAFMFVDVPEPVWKTSIGNWSSWSPATIASAAVAIRSASSASSLPRSALTRAAAPLMAAIQRTTATGTRSPETGKFATAFDVSPPHSCRSAPLIPSVLADRGSPVDATVSGRRPASRPEATSTLAGVDTNGREAPRKRKPGRPGSKLELVLIVAGALFFALVIQAFAVKPYVIPSGSMLPTLQVGQRILVDRFSHTLGSDPKLGDITVFHPPSGSSDQVRRPVRDRGRGSVLRPRPVDRAVLLAPDRAARRTTTSSSASSACPAIASRSATATSSATAWPAKEPFADGCSDPRLQPARDRRAAAARTSSWATTATSPTTAATGGPSRARGSSARPS